MVGLGVEVGITVAVGKGVEVGGELVGVDGAGLKVGATVAVGGEVSIVVEVSVVGVGADLGVGVGADVGVGVEVGIAAAGSCVASLPHATAKSISRAKLKYFSNITRSRYPCLRLSCSTIAHLRMD